MRWFVAPMVLIAGLVATAAHADDKRPAPTWYGTQTLIADGVSLPLIVAAPPAGVISYALITPIVHWAHGNVGTGFGSLALRVLSPIVGAVAGCAVGGCGGRGQYEGAAAGAGLAMLGVVALDAAAFAYEEPEVVRVPRAKLHAVPTVVFGRGLATLSLSASF